MKGKLLVLSGLSAAGKGTIVKEILKRFDNYALSISATTREKRNNELDGVDYFFVSKEKFEEMIKNGELIEYANYVGNFYGTPRKYVEEKLDSGINIILEIEMQGALQIKKIYSEAILVFIIPKDAKTQRERLISRGRESNEQIEKRIKQAVVDATYAVHYDYVIINDDLSKAVKDIEEIVDGTYDKNKNEQTLKILNKIVEDIKEEQNV
ncbi:MAG: guanylate kinase [Lachnospiraceae bacterium]|nr:guanylate kinase [Lachnospiraceae bacterium]